MSKKQRQLIFPDEESSSDEEEEEELTPWQKVWERNREGERDIYVFPE